MKRLINLGLILTTLAGVFFLAKQRGAHSLVQVDYDRLKTQYGALNVVDSDKYFVTYLKSDDPMVFQWRVFTPAGLSILEKIKFNGRAVSGGRHRATDSRETLQLARFRFDIPGANFYHRNGYGSSSMSLGNEKLQQFLKLNWSSLNIDILAEQGPAQIESDRVVRLLAIRIPVELRKEFKKQFGTKFGASQQDDSPLLELIFGTEPAFLSDQTSTQEHP